MRIIFVIDIMNGIVVRGYKGERESYKPIHLFSKVVDTSDPVDVIKKLKPKYLYVADLDKIMGRGSNLNTILTLKKYVDEIMLDYGFRSPNEVFYSVYPILGTETFNITKLDDLIYKNVYVSVDLREQSLLDASSSFKSWIDVMEFLNSYSLRGVIILTLHKVGTSSSLDFNLLKKAVEISDNPIYIGGGVKDFEDVIKAKEMGCKGVLVSTSVHNRALPVDLIKKGEIKATF